MAVAKEGELVVTAANFLIDAESNLKAALGGMQKSETAKPVRVADAETPVAAPTSPVTDEAPKRTLRQRN